MGLSHNSDGRRSDKETQSPMLKIFKDMMQKDLDPEKARLLKEKHKRKKDRVFGQRSKVEQRLYDSNSTDRQKETKQNTVQEMNDNSTRYDNRKRSGSIQAEMKNSQWFWQVQNDNENMKEKKRASDTCSCVSCALKNIISSERTCIICLVLLFLVSVSAALLLVFKALPTTDTGIPDLDDDMMNKIEGIKEKRQLNDVYDKALTERPYWEQLPGDRFDIPGLMTSESNKLKFRETNLLENSIADDITNILNADEIMNSSNERLRDFYKRLLETDAQIKKVKEIVFDNNNSNGRILRDRFKRSSERKLKSIRKQGLLKNTHKNIINVSDKERNKRVTRGSNITGFIIKEEKFVVKYEPYKKRKDPSHFHNHNRMSPKDHSIYEQNKKEHKISEQTLKPTISGGKNVNNIKSHVDSTNHNESSGYNLDWSDKISPALGFDVALDVSKTDNNIEEKSKHLKSIGHRKLLQVIAEEEDEKKYKDLKELLKDDEKNTDDEEKQDKKIKEDFRDSIELPIQNSQPDLPKLYNSNRRYPMPLYPEELNSIIQQAALENFNIEIPVDTKDRQPEMESEENDLNDVQYIEDYSDNKYNKMIKVAQAYSDYGVLNDKKEVMADKDRIRNDKKIKTLLHTKLIKDNIDRLRKGIECGKKQQIIKTIQKHIKFLNNPIQSHPTTFMNNNNEKIYTNIILNSNKNTTDARVKNDLFQKRYGRSLKSIKDNPTLIEDYDIIKDNEEDKKRIIENVRDFQNNSFINKFSFLSSMKDWFLTKTVVPVQVTTEIARNNNTDSYRYGARNFMGYDKNNNTKKYLGIMENLRPINSSTKLVKEAANKEPDDNILPIILTMISKNEDPIMSYQKENNINTKNEPENELTKSIENKTVVKRNVDDKFVFWNDLYDNDEYGVKLDYLDEKRKRNKHDIKKTRIQKSKDWIKEKVDKLRSKNNKTKLLYTIALNGLSTKKTSVEETLQKMSKQRKTRNLEFDEEKSMEDIFKALTANMKKVCHEAANAIQNTRNLEVRESKEDMATSNLMQRLVRLMSDLVDIQVQEKTCAKLPSDLRQFLESLVAPSDEHSQPANLNLDISEYTSANEEYGGEKSSDKSLEFPSLTEDTHEDDRTECLGTIRALQDLVEEYEGLSNEDKSKMAGVKEYLQRQLEYLNKFATIDDTNIYNEYENHEVRDKRDSNQMRDKDNISTGNKKNKNFIKFVKKLKKKYTKAVTFGITRATDTYTQDADLTSKTPIQRNLNDADVYYRALEEAKKTTNQSPTIQ